MAGKQSARIAARCKCGRSVYFEDDMNNINSAQPAKKTIGRGCNTPKSKNMNLDKPPESANVQEQSPAEPSTANDTVVVTSSQPIKEEKKKERMVTL
jgi:hypothetical protein